MAELELHARSWVDGLVELDAARPYPRQRVTVFGIMTSPRSMRTIVAMFTGCTRMRLHDLGRKARALR
jgi:hypothetical protein